MLRKEQEARQAQTWKLIGALVVAIMFLGSTVGFVFFYTGKNAQTQNGENGGVNQEYKGYKFVRVQGGWQTETAEGILLAAYLPSEVLSIECNCAELDTLSLRSQKTYFIANSSAEIAAANELLRLQTFTRIQQACLPENADAAGCEDLPLRSCENATAQAKVLIFSERAKNESVNYNNNCLILEGKNLIRAADRAIYKVYGIE